MLQLQIYPDKIHVRKKQFKCKLTWSQNYIEIKVIKKIFFLSVHYKTDQTLPFTLYLPQKYCELVKNIQDILSINKKKILYRGKVESLNTNKNLLHCSHVCQIFS